jgi:integrase
MPKTQLNAAFCAAATCPPGKKRIDHYDTVTTGFVLEVRASGLKTYYLRYFEENGRQRQHKIACYEDVTFDQARKVAKRLRSEVVLGGNPADKKEKRKAIPTYATVAEQHLAYARTYQRRPENVERVIRLHLLPRWGKLRLDEIKQQTVAQWLASKREEGFAPATVEKFRVTLGRSFELAARWNIPGAEHNPVRGVPRPKFNNAREHYLSQEGAQKLYRALEQSSNPLLKVIVGLLLLTGARKMELLKAKWEHVDLERKVLYIPDSKTGKARHVPLSQAALDLIGLLPRWPGCPWLIANPKTRKPYTDIKRAWDTARTAAGLPGLRIHDLRHSAASFMINAGIDLYAVGRILGHADHQSTMRYSHLSHDTLRAAVEAGAAKLNVDWAGGQADG